MKFMITWEVHPGELHDTLGIFSAMTPKEESEAMGDDLKLLGRWHDLARGRGVAIFESESAEAVSAYALGWNSMMDLDISVVLDDEETRALGKTLSS